MDGARIANATAALGGDVAALRSFTVDAGVDVLTFGGTKNGLLGGEAVVFLRPGARPPGDVPAQAGHPAAVQDALRRRPVHRPARRRPAGSSSPATPTRWPARCTRAVAGLPGVDVGRRPQVNSLFPVAAARRRSSRCGTWCFFWDWDVARHQVRWMTAWDTTAEDVERFAAGVTRCH